jgi:superfamily II DNA or RNA helicase
MNEKIVLRHMAKVFAPKDKLLDILDLYSYVGFGDAEYNTYVYAGNGIIYLPPNIEKLKVVAKILNTTIEDQRSEGQDPDTSWIQQPGFELRPYQVKAAQELTSYINKNQYGVFIAPCGSGKTIMCALAGGLTKRKNLILIDQGSLFSNWEEAYRVIWGKQLQVIKRDTTSFSDACAVTFQLLHKNPELMSRIRDTFGICIIDESQVITAKTFKSVMSRLNNKYRLATSATFFHKYLPREVLEDICGGQVAVSMKDSRAIPCQIEFLSTGVPISSSDPEMFTRKTLPELAKNDARNQIIIDRLNQLVAEKRRVLAIAITMEQAKYMAREVKGRVAVYIGTTSQKQDSDLKQRFEAGELDIVFSCLKFRKGVDFPSADTLMLTRPYNNEGMVVQLRGRIVRSMEGKKVPLVIDLVDRGELSWRWARARYEWYRSLGDNFSQESPYFLDTF